jgi:hypothetical protein
MYEVALQQVSFRVSRIYIANHHSTIALYSSATAALVCAIALTRQANINISSVLKLREVQLSAL